MFGNASLPSRIFSYGAKPPLADGGGLALVENQMWIAHRYRNALVKVELRRRARVEVALRALSSDLMALDSTISDAEGKLGSLRASILRNNADARKRQRPSTEALAAITRLRGKLKDLYARRKSARKALFESEEFKSRQAEIDAWTRRAQKRLRAGSGLYWGNYLLVQQAMSGARSGAPPKFHGDYALHK